MDSQQGQDECEHGGRVEASQLNSREQHVFDFSKRGVIAVCTSHFQFGSFSDPRTMTRYSSIILSQPSIMNNGELTNGSSKRISFLSKMGGM